MISYRVDVDDVHAHRFSVTLTLPRPSTEQRLSLPVWIPGSYMVREFSRHLYNLSARQGRRPVALEQIDKTTWVAHCPVRAALVVKVSVYAFDTSVRTAFLDSRRGYFNGTSMLLRVHGREAEPQRLVIGRLPPRWQVATAMRGQRLDAAGRGSYQAADYDELVDHPFELGSFWRGRFEAGAVAHEFVVAGAWPGFDGERLLADTRRICTAQIALWHGAQPARAAKPPFNRYRFIVNAVDEGYGGLEHRASCALIAARRDLPRRAMKGVPEGYARLLGLISHEYFHAWNVKRLKPSDFVALDYARENYTHLLWFFEGFTSYYDDLMLLRAGLIDAAQYLNLLAKTINHVLATPGRGVQSVAQASFDAWVKYYRSDENTPNATVSYYAKGALIALALDLSLRRRKAATLDHLMRALWQRSQGGAIGEADIVDALQALGGRALAAELKRWVHGTDDLPLAEALSATGVHWATESAGFAAALGLRLSEGPVSGVQVKSVLAGTAAQRAGVSAGDELIAINGWRVRRIDEALGWIDPVKPFELMLVRDQRVLTLKVDPSAGSALTQTVQLSLVAKPGRAQAARRRAWLNA